MKTIYLAGGCFWGLQKFLDQFDGIVETEVGYANGPEGAVVRQNGPSYEEVLPLSNFYPAEEYHQKYLDKNPHGYCHIPAAMLSLQQK